MKENEKSRLNELTDFTEDFQERLRKSYERIVNKKLNPTEILNKKNISKVYSKNENEKEKSKEKQTTNLTLVINKKIKQYKKLYNIKIGWKIF